MYVYLSVHHLKVWVYNCYTVNKLLLESLITFTFYYLCIMIIYSIQINMCLSLCGFIFSIVNLNYYSVAYMYCKV